MFVFVVIFLENDTVCTDDESHGEWTNNIHTKFRERKKVKGETQGDLPEGRQWEICTWRSVSSIFPESYPFDSPFFVLVVRWIFDLNSHKDGERRKKKKVQYGSCEKEYNFKHKTRPSSRGCIISVVKRRDRPHPHSSNLRGCESEGF